MAKCNKCGKKGLFFKVNAEGLCSECSKNSCDATFTKDTYPISNDILLNRPNSNVVAVNHLLFSVHPEIRSLLWFQDGTNKNTFPINDESSIKIYGRTIILKTKGEDEPSAITHSIPIASILNFHTQRPPYYPRYDGLTPEQCRIYWHLLENPYNSDIDVGYVFIFYYGLERHLYAGDYEKAFNVILKLRDVHSNKSFQQYSARALMLSSLIHGRSDLANKFLNSIDKDYEFQLDANLFVICKAGLDIPLYPVEIMKLHKAFLFDNNRYIKNAPTLFLSELTNVIVEKNGFPYISIRELLKDKATDRIYEEQIIAFANTSLIKAVPAPDYLLLCGEITQLLHLAHENVKIKLAANRKKTISIVPEMQPSVSPKTKPSISKKFDISNAQYIYGMALVPQAQQESALNDILSLNIIFESTEISIFPKMIISKEDVNFEYLPTMKDNVHFSHIEDVPKTKTGKDPKFSQCLHFTSGKAFTNTINCIFGKVYYLPNADIGRAEIIFWHNNKCYIIKCTRVSDKLVISSIDKSIDGVAEKIYRR